MTNIKPFTISLLAHTAFLLMLCLSIQLPSRHPLTGIDQHVVSSHLVTALNRTTTVTQPAISKALTLTRKTLPAPSPATTAAAQPSTAGEPTPQLAALLHDAIDRQKQYPASAQEQEREGRVTLAFKLFPNGSISDLRIKHSSGTSSLDQAALAAVNAAAPFSDVEKYLHTTTPYQLDVVFTLTV